MPVYSLVLLIVIVFKMAKLITNFNPIFLSFFALVKMAENAENKVYYEVSNSTILVLFFLLAILLILLFVMYKYLNREAHGKYTIRRIVYREGGLRDRVRGTAITFGNRLGVQLWPQSDADLDEENGDECDDDDDDAQVNSGNEEEENSDEDDTMQDDEPKTDAKDELNAEKEESKKAIDSSDEEEEAEAPEVTEVKLEIEPVKTVELGSDIQARVETSGPIVINLNQLSGGVIWSEEDGGGDKGGDVTAL